jgi:hypothetical protein
MSLEGNARKLVRAPPLVGLEVAPDFFINGISSIEFLGVNTQLILHRDVSSPKGPIRRVPYTATFPTGATPYMTWQLYEFCREHGLSSKWFHDATR